MENAIKSAEKGGYDFKLLLDKLGINNEYKVDIRKKYLTVRSFQGNVKQLCSFEKLLLDQAFWQALGKQQGWYGYQCCDCGYKHFSQLGFTECCSNWTKAKTIPAWQSYWHSFIDHLADGGDIDEFFNKLLK